MELEITAIKNNYDALEIKDFDILLDSVKKRLLDYQPYIIDNDYDKKKLKAIRADLNKLANQIDRRRIDIKEELTSQFENQCDEIKSLIVSKIKEYDKEIKTYEDSLKKVVVEKPKIYVATLKFTDATKCDLLTKFCLDNGIELTIK